MSESTAVVGVVAKHSHPEAKRLVGEVLAFLRARKIAYRVCEQTADELGLTLPAEEKALRENLSGVCTHIVVLGGDGTLISVCRHASPKAPVIVGVNLGTLGFLTEITSEELFDVLPKALDGSLELEERSLLEIKVRRGKGDPSTYSSLNDVVLTKTALARIYDIDVAVDGQHAAVLRGDGCIVATPGGSTAYSLAAGGSIVHPLVDAILLTPICPHSLTSRPLVIPGKSTISLKLANNTEGSNVFLTIDGQEGMPLAAGDEVLVTTSKNRMLFAKSPSKNYYEVLGTKLKWAHR